MKQSVNKKIVPMKLEHAEEVADQHFRYTKSMLSELGRSACSAFYNNSIKSENNFGYVYIEDSTVLGFIFGTIDNSQIFKGFKIRIKPYIRLRPAAEIYTGNFSIQDKAVPGIPCPEFYPRRGC